MCGLNRFKDHCMFRLLSRLKNLKMPLRRLRSYGNLSKLVSSLKVELDSIQLACDLDPSNLLLREDLAHVLPYQQARMGEENAVKQRAKVTWLNEGDYNTKFFHNVVKERRNRQHIHVVCDRAGVYAYGEDVPMFLLIISNRFLGYVMRP